jgi:hypothetical protein
MRNSISAREIFLLIQFTTVLGYRLGELKQLSFGSRSPMKHGHTQIRHGH